MVEVFKTDVGCRDIAVQVLNRIHQQFDQYKANFDLQDCDRILRVIAPGAIASCKLLEMLMEMGISAEVLKDDLPPKKMAVAANGDYAD